MNRPDVLSRFIDALADAANNAAAPDSAAQACAERVFTALDTPAEIADLSNTEPLPAYRYFSDALDNANSATAPVAVLAEAFRDLAPLLSWRRRPDADTHGSDFYDGHANAWIIAADGLEQRRDVMVGASLLAPGVRYPEHQHAPEEIYVVMSDGDWYRDGGGWSTPGIGGIVYHEPWLMHAMRAGEQPLLAVWCLWVGEH